MRTQRKKIIIVEDEGVVALDLKNRLGILGYEVLEIFDNGEELLESAVDFDPDLVLMDIMLLGVLDGVKTAELYLKLKDIPIIFLTAYTDKNTFERAKLTDPYGYLPKPFDQKDLEINIEMAIFRHEVSKKIAAERQKFFHILGSIHDAVIAINDQEQIIYFNHFAQDYFSFQSETIGQNLDTMLPFIKQIPENQSFISDLLNGKLLQYNIQNVKVKFQKKTLAFDLSIVPLKSADHFIEGLVIVCHDVSEKNRFMEILLRSERKYRNLFERNLAGVVQTNLEGIILQCNDAFAKIFGYQSGTDMIGLDSSMFYHSPVERASLVNNLLKFKYLKNIEIYLKTKDNQPIWVLENIHVVNTANNEVVIEATVVDITAKKQIENELKKSQNNLVSLIENTDNYIWSIDADFRLISFNSRFYHYFQEVFGFYPENGFSLYEMSEKYQKFWFRYYQMAINGESFTKEMTTKFNGKILYYEVSFHPIFNQTDVSGVTVYAVDITEKKLQQLDRQRYLDLLDAVFHQNDDALFIINPKNGKILDFNSQSLKLFQRNHFESLGDIFCFLPKSHHSKILKSFLNEKNWNDESKITVQDKEIWVSYSLNHIDVANEKLILVKVSDITDKKVADEMRIILESAIENSAEGILIFDNHYPPKVVYANRAYFQIIGKENVVLNQTNKFGEDLIHLIPGDSRSFYRNGEPFSFETKHLKEDGTEILLEIEISPIKIGNQIHNWVAILRDITEKKRQQQELIAAKLNQQSLILKAIVDTQEKERQRFAEDLHDSLGQMLSALKINLGSLEHIDNQSHFKSRLKKSMQLLDNAIHELRAISHDLMPSSLEQLGLSTALMELCKTLNHENQTSVSFQRHGEVRNMEKPIEISLYRVSQELLNNAIKHSNAKTIYLQLYYRDDGISLVIEDDGKGFDYQKMIQTSKGIGLKNIEHRIRLIGGTIDFETSEGKGFLCSIEVPYSKSAK